MSGLPTSISFLSGLRPLNVPLNPPPNYYGYGSSNQAYRNSVQAPNLGGGEMEPQLQSDLYVPDNSGSITMLQAEIDTINGEITTIDGSITTLQGDITTINGQITTIQGDITTLQGEIATTVTAIGPVGSSPNGNAGVITSQTLHLEPADASNPGLVSTGTQSFAGDKTFTGSVTTQKTFNLPITTSNSVGAILQGAAGSETPILHTGGTNSIFVGSGSAATTNTGSANACFGNVSGSALTSGANNTLIGEAAGALVTTGTQNTIIGSACSNVSSGSNNIAIGYNCGNNIGTASNTICIGTNGSGASGEIDIGNAALHTKTNLTGYVSAPAVNMGPPTGASTGSLYVNDVQVFHTFGTENTFVGALSGNYTMTGSRNACLGDQTGQALTTGNINTIVGSRAGKFVTTGAQNALFAGGYDITTGSQNTCLGSGDSITTGSQNIAIGYLSGNSVTTASNTINIGNLGVNTNNTIYLGDQAIHTATTLAGNVSTNGTIVASNFSGSSSGTNTGNVTLAAVGAVPNANAMTLTGQSLNLQPCDGSNPGVITAGAQTIGGNKTFTGTIAASNVSGSTSGTNTGDITLSAVGAAPNANAMTLTGQALQMQPCDGSNPGVMTAGTQTIGGDKTFNATLATNGNLSLPTSSSTAGQITINGNTVLHATTSFATKSSFFAGNGSGNFTNSGNGNTAVGYQCGSAITSGSGNWLAGYQAGTAITTGQNNCCTGNTSGNAITTGSNNICIGSSAGNTITTTGNNIIIANTGTAGDSGVIKIGTNGTHTTCAIQGISSATSTSGVAVLVNASGVLGTITSSMRFKNNIADITNDPIDKMLTLPVHTFTYKNDPNHKLQYGMIAEEVAQIEPNWCAFDNDDPKALVNTVRYLDFIPILVAAVARSEKKIAELQSQLAKS